MEVFKILSVTLVVREDTYFSVGSIILVWIYMSLHLRTGFGAHYTQAPLLAFLGMAIVALSFPVGLVFFRMSGNDQMAIINYLGLFLLIGIGVDKIFKRTM